MKKIQSLYIIIFMAVFSLSLFAKEKQEDIEMPETKMGYEYNIIKEASQPEELKPFKRKSFLLNLYGGVGMSFPTGEIFGQGDQKTHIAFGYAAGLNLCYKFFNHGGPILGAQYSSKPIKISGSVMSDKTEMMITTSFVDIMAGYFAQFGWFYFEVGAFYGIRVDKWKVELKKSGSGTEKYDLTGSKYKWTKDEFGPYLKLGIAIPVTKFFSITVGVQAEFSVLYVYEYRDHLRSNLVSFTLGTTFRI